MKKDFQEMQKVTQVPASPMDVFLLPVWVHKRISIRYAGLLAAFLFVGIFNLAFIDNIFKLNIFTGNPLAMFLKLCFFIVIAIIVGAIDVICTMYPIADFALMIGRRSEKYVNKRIAVIMMKSYALSHIIFIIPYAFAVYSGIDWMGVSPQSSATVRLLFAVIFTLSEFLPVFQLGIIYRTLSIRTRIQVFGKLILVLAAYFWMEISRTAVIFMQSIGYNLIKSL